MAKIAPAQINYFIQKPTKNFILVFGKDEGLVSERCTHLAKAIIDDLSDPFRLSKTHFSELKQKPEFLFDEAYAQSLMGGTRLVWIQQATDSLTKDLEALIERGNCPNTVLIEAGDLGPQSKLRKLFEKNQQTAAIPCYHDESFTISQLAKDIFTKKGYRFDREVLSFLQTHLGDDRRVSRSEIEKLCLYCADTKSITLKETVDTIVDHTFLNMEAFCFHFSGQHYQDLFKEMDRLVIEMSEVAVLRVLQKHFLRFYQARLMMDEGLSPDKIVLQMRPPIFYKFKQTFISQLRNWTKDRLNKTLFLLYKAEKNAKSSSAGQQHALHDLVIHLHQEKQSKIKSFPN